MFNFCLQPVFLQNLQLREWLEPTFHHVTSEAGSEDHFSRQWCLRGQQFDQTMSWKQRRCGCLVMRMSRSDGGCMCCHEIFIWQLDATWDDMWQVGMVKDYSLVRKSPWGLLKHPPRWWCGYGIDQIVSSNKNFLVFKTLIDKNKSIAKPTFCQR